MGDELTLAPFALNVGAVDQKVVIIEAPPAIELSSSALGAVVAGPVIRDLPLNGRSWTDLAKSEPGVAGIYYPDKAFDQGASRGNRGFGAQIAISGGRPSQNNYRLDGISINDYANSGPGSVIGVSLGVDAIGEFSVLTSNYSAEYGKTSGGVINAVTRGGTNQFHGSAYSFFRNSALDAKNYFDVGSTPPPFTRYQYGGSAGGPIWKDRTFFFGDFEAIRQNLSTTASAAASSRTLLAPGSPIPLCSNTSACFPSPTRTPLPQEISPSTASSTQEIVTENFFTTRIDHTDHLRMTASSEPISTTTPPFTIGDKENLTPGLVEDPAPGPDSRRKPYFGAPSFINSLRFGLNRQNVANNIGVKALNPLAGDTSLGIYTLGAPAPPIFVPGLTRVVGGVGSSPSYLFRFTTFQGYDDAFLTRGTHPLKFGMAFERLQNNILALSNPNGLFNFKSTSTFHCECTQQVSSGDRQHAQSA